MAGDGDLAPQGDALRGALGSILRDLAPSIAGSPYVLADLLLDRLDAAGLRLISARLPELRESRATNVTLAQYQQILGERNALKARLDRPTVTQPCGCRIETGCALHDIDAQPPDDEPPRG